MNAASFELRCWAHTGTKHSETQNVLGLKWDTETDELYCVSPETDMGISDNIFNWKLLSIVNSIYDPLGFTSPATLLPKLLLQEAWCNKLDWNEELTLICNYAIDDGLNILLSLRNVEFLAGHCTLHYVVKQK
ncbi:uncharacterized protein CEXT_453381 [Caerostris extrusa]|uniref:Uncharacterized protein n=1 Tax=Caerostris extrusa TaxID=172846 RepID=A0AAV4WEW8_CAEEX|nr:uncharacterized protein CEXT_453381 [Caerostris extrusa]